MMGLKEAGARAFETIYHALNKKKICRLLLAEDPFDGRVYSIDSFYSAYCQYFETPWEFFRDFHYDGAPNLRDGFHPNEVQPKPTPHARWMIFDSPVKTGWVENNVVPFKWFRNNSRPSKTILLFVPGWGRSSQSIEVKMCERLVSHGIDAGLLTKPFHQARTPAGAYTGEYFISANLFWTIANFRQLTAEIRLLIQYMRNHYDQVGLIGMSSGGFQSALAADCEEVDFIFPFITGCQLGSITWNGLITQYVRAELEKKGVDEASLNKVWSITDQAVLGRHCKARYRKHYISLYGRVMPLRNQILLWDIFGKSDRLDLQSSHYSIYFLMDFVADDIAAYVKRCTP
jgi:hypothetical protein